MDQNQDNGQPAQAPQPMQPVEPVQPTQPVQPSQLVEPVQPAQPAQPIQSAGSPQLDQPDQAESFYDESGDQASLTDEMVNNTQPVTWTAQEYVHQERNTLWYVIFGLVALALIAADIFLLKSYTFSLVVVVAAVALIVYIRRPARTITYALSPNQGLYIGEKLYHFDEFKSFGILKDEHDDLHQSILLIPRKRFSPAVSVFFPVESGEEIVDILGSRLAMEEVKLDILDTIVQKLHL